LDRAEERLRRQEPDDRRYCGQVRDTAVGFLLIFYGRT
jgi:hypothetical protein